MANKTIPQLDAASSVTDATLFDTDTGSAEQKATGAQVKSYVNGGVKVYRAQIFDIGTNIIFENTIGNIVWTVNAGNVSLTGTLAGAFPTGKTFVIAQILWDDNQLGFTQSVGIGTDAITVRTYSPQIGQDWSWQETTVDFIYAMIEIRVYP